MNIVFIALLNTIASCLHVQDSLSNYGRIDGNKLEHFIARNMLRNYLYKIEQTKCRFNKSKFMKTYVSSCNRRSKSFSHLALSRLVICKANLRHKKCPLFGFPLDFMQFTRESSEYLRQ
jgi:hypothetical protein